MGPYDLKDEIDMSHRYKIALKNPGAHLFEVTLNVAEPDASGQEFIIPAWIPGSYLIRDFARKSRIDKSGIGRPRN